MISLFPLALGQLLDCQLDIATQLPGKPHYFKLFRLLGRIGVVLFRRDLGGIDRRLCSAKTYPHFLVLAGRAVGHVDGENLGTFLIGQTWISSNLLTYFLWSNKILQSLLLMMVPLTMGDEMMSSTSWVTTTASPKNFRTVLKR